jgi:adenine phosphoribosyltransferase
VQFRDIMPLLADSEGLYACVKGMRAHLAQVGIDRVDLVAGIEARGFILGSALALDMGVGFLPVRKAGKLPGEVVSQSYDLEYGTATLEVQCGIVEPGTRVVLVDDVLATGGTAEAASALLSGVGAEVLGLLSLLEIPALGGRERLSGLDVWTIHRI